MALSRSDIPAGDEEMSKTFTIVKVFSATMAREREVLGERVTAWIQSRPEVEVL